MPQGQRRAARKSPRSIGRVSFPGWSFAFVIGYELTRFVQLSVDSPAIDFSDRNPSVILFGRVSRREINSNYATRILKKKTKYSAINSRRFESRIIKSFSWLIISKLVFPILTIARLRNYTRLSCPHALEGWNFFRQLRESKSEKGN